MRVNVGLLLAKMSNRKLTRLGPRDSEEDWQDEAGGRDGCIERDEECYVGCILYYSDACEFPGNQFENVRSRH